MSTLLEASYTLIRAPDPAQTLRLIDHYLDLWEKDSEAFILPRQYRHFAPIIAAYAGKPDRFRNYVRVIRDEALAAYGALSSKYNDLQALVRMLDARAAQRLRRERTLAAGAWIREQRPDLSSEQRSVWLRRLERRWSQERLEYLKQARRVRKVDRLSMDEQRDILDAYWADLAERVTRGDLPTYEEVMSD